VIRHELRNPAQALPLPLRLPTQPDAARLANRLANARPDGAFTRRL
jgi:hypothetical protein